MVTDRTATAGRPLTAAVEAALAGGVRAVQLREKDMHARELWNLAVDLRNLTRCHGARFLINDRIDVALAVEADGAHLPGAGFPPSAARRLLGPGALIGASIHDPAEIPGTTGADFLLFGPVYETPSKAGFGRPQGLDRLRQTCERSPLPVFAIGGMTPELVGDVIAAGAAGVAAISALLGAPDPGAAASAFLEALRQVQRRERKPS